MKSPFPGMDPYLEQYWGDAHTSLATYVKDNLQRQLPTDLIARVQEHVAVESADTYGNESQSYYPDVRVEESRKKSARQSKSSRSSLAVVDFVEVSRKSEPMTQRSIRIIAPKSGNRIVTAIEIISPSNKIGVIGRTAYEKKRNELLEAEVSLVEIDLIREGIPNLAVRASSIPRQHRQPYRICIVRSWRADIARIRGVSLQQRLPVVPIPLREYDDEIFLDLQAMIDMVYENGRYDHSDYGQELDPPLSKADAKWANALLREKGLRE